MVKQASQQARRTVIPSVRFPLRKGAYGGSAGGSGGCEERRKKDSLLQRKATSEGQSFSAPSIPDVVLCSSGQPLGSASRGPSEPHFGHDFGNVRVFAPMNSSKPFEFLSADAMGALDFGKDEDPIHRPIIEKYRRERGLPLSGKDEHGEAIGPSEAEIKYVIGPSLPPAFTLDFVSDSTPSAPDHTQAHPGPGGLAADLAGYTRVTLGGQMNLDWDALPAKQGGTVPIFLKSIEITYRLSPIIAMVSSKYAVNSCPYNVTWQHELSHVDAFRRIFASGRESLKHQLLNAQVPVVTEPMAVEPAKVNAAETDVEQRLKNTIIAHRQSLKAQLEADRDQKDSPSAYAATHARCPLNQW
jgi:hypothetical protein